ncbi:cuticle protein BD2 [Penaeus vannamei]|uniref:Cuticle protein BD2 n=1 Tax=Penaeus vannamei TaxID=6689 RepID=A0A423U1B6_PENVA|nr:cuticle protein BD2 [Penaeus vannamei]
MDISDNRSHQTIVILNTIADSLCSISSSADPGSSHAHQSRPDAGPINTVHEARRMQCDSRQAKQDIMKSLCPGRPTTYGVYGAPYQPKWTGPVAATVPAGVDGTITPVSDTYEVSAARNAFFKAYNAQLAAVGAYRYGTPAYHHATPAVHVSVAAPAAHHSALTYGAAPAPVGDTPAVAAAKADFFRLYNLQAAAAAAAPDHDAPRYYY